jgi:hypothetical protein
MYHSLTTVSAQLGCVVPGSPTWQLALCPQILLRRFWSGHFYLRRRTLGRVLLSVLFVSLLAYVTAFMETWTISAVRPSPTGWSCVSTVEPHVLPLLTAVPLLSLQERGLHVQGWAGHVRHLLCRFLPNVFQVSHRNAVACLLLWHACVSLSRSPQCPSPCCISNTTAVHVVANVQAV